MPLTHLNDSAFDAQLEGVYFGMWNFIPRSIKPHLCGVSASRVRNHQGPPIAAGARKKDKFNTFVVHGNEILTGLPGEGNLPTCFPDNSPKSADDLGGDAIRPRLTGTSTCFCDAPRSTPIEVRRSRCVQPSSASPCANAVMLSSPL
jgi:hypothetical protein